MDILEQLRKQTNRLTTAKDDQLVAELRLYYSELRASLKNLERQPGADKQIIEIKCARLKTLRSAAYRLEQLAQQDHLRKFGTGGIT